MIKNAFGTHRPDLSGCTNIMDMMTKSVEWDIDCMALGVPLYGAKCATAATDTGPAAGGPTTGPA